MGLGPQGTVFLVFTLGYNGLEGEARSLMHLSCCMDLLGYGQKVAFRGKCMSIWIWDKYGAE